MSQQQMKKGFGPLLVFFPNHRQSGHVRNNPGVIGRNPRNQSPDQLSRFLLVLYAEIGPGAFRVTHHQPRFTQQPQVP